MSVLGRGIFYSVLKYTIYFDSQSQMSLKILDWEWQWNFNLFLRYVTATLIRASQKQYNHKKNEKLQYTNL